MGRLAATQPKRKIVSESAKSAVRPAPYPHKGKAEIRPANVLPLKNTPARTAEANRSAGGDLAKAYFAEVYPRAIEVLGDADKAIRWLGRPIPSLEYETPISLLRSNKGRDAVLDVLGRLEHGVF